MRPTFFSQINSLRWSTGLPYLVALALVVVYLYGVFSLLHLKDLLGTLDRQTPSFEETIFVLVNVLLLSTGVMAFAGLIFYGAASGINRALQKWGEEKNAVLPLLSRGKIVLYYQSIVSLQDSKIIGCEVLCRIQKPDGSIIEPDTFIPSLNNQESQWSLDSCVIKQAIKELSESVDKSREIKVSFNLFPSSVNAKKLHGHIIEILSNMPHPGLHITLEVIEKEYLDDLPSQAASLKSMGYELSVDDFGTGFSNLGNIVKLRPNCLKIDKSFIQHIGNGSNETILVPTIVHLANTIGCQIVAEGIETMKQKEILTEMGVHLGQGFLFSPPLPLDEFVRRFNSQQVLSADISIH